MDADADDVEDCPWSTNVFDSSIFLICRMEKGVALSYNCTGVATLGLLNKNRFHKCDARTRQILATRGDQFNTFINKTSTERRQGMPPKCYTCPVQAPIKKVVAACHHQEDNPAQITKP